MPRGRIDGPGLRLADLKAAFPPRIEDANATLGCEARLHQQAVQEGTPVKTVCSDLGGIPSCCRSRQIRVAPDSVLDPKSVPSDSPGNERSRSRATQDRQAAGAIENRYV